MAAARPEKGFTLLEMLFVLAIMGLLVGLTIPRYAGNMRQRELAAERQTIETRLVSLPRRARLTGVNLVLPADLGKKDLGDGAAVLPVPEGWQLKFEPPWVITLHATCSTSTIELSRKDDPTQRYRYRTSEPDCEIASTPS
jgi:prepilin-type N-terminal cleavage/methylation domain-containing protein